MTFLENLETTAQSKGRYKVLPEIEDGYLMVRMQWSYHDLATCPIHVLNQVKIVLHLDNMAQNSKSKT